MWKRGEIAPEEQFLLFSTIFCYLFLDFHVKTGTRISLRYKRLFEIREVEITRVDCISFCFRVGNLPMDPEKVEIMDNGVIMFKAVSTSEQGSYLCTATNDMGTISATASLIVEGMSFLDLSLLTRAHLFKTNDVIS